MRFFGGLWREYRRAFSLFSANARLFLLGSFLFGVGNNMIQLLLNLYLKELGLGEAGIGSVLAARAFGSFIIALPASFVVARADSRYLLSSAAVLTAAAFAGSALLEGFGPIAASVLMSGAFSSLFQVAGGPFFMKNSSPEERVHLFSLNGALGMGTGVLGSLFGGALKDLVFAASGDELYAYRAALLLGALFVASAVAPFLAIREHAKAEAGEARAPVREAAEGPAAGAASAGPGRPAGRVGRGLERRRESREPGAPEPAARGLGAPARRAPIGRVDAPLYIRLLMPGFFVGMGAGLTIPYLNLYFKNEFRLGDSFIGLIFALGQIGTFLGMVSGPAIATRLGKAKTIFLMQAISVPFILVLTYLRFLPAVIVAFVVRQSLMNMSSPISDNFALEQVPPNQQHLMNALRMLNWTGSWMVSARISGGLIATRGFAPSFTLTAGLYALSSVLFWAFFLRPGAPGAERGRARPAGAGGPLEGGGEP
jgi:MFS family permease